MSILCRIFSICAVATSLEAAEFLVLDPSDSIGGTYNGPGFTRTAGYEFTVGYLPLSVVALGARDWQGTGLVSFHELGIWDANQNLLAMVIVAPGPSSDGFRYSSLSQSLLLIPGQNYTVGETYVNLDPDRIGLSDARVGDSPSYNSAVTFVQIRFGDNTNGMMFPDVVGYSTEVGLFGPNLQFDIVPEPSSRALALLGLGAVSFILFLRKIRNKEMSPV